MRTFVIIYRKSVRKRPLVTTRRSVTQEHHAALLLCLPLPTPLQPLTIKSDVIQRTFFRVHQNAKLTASSCSNSSKVARLVYSTGGAMTADGQL
jgi:hypothetical protein